MIATAVLCYIIWLCLTGQIPKIFTGEASAQILIAGGVISILIALIAGRFLVYRNPFHFFKPLRLLKLLLYVIIILPWEITKANVDVALRAISPKLRIKPGFVKIPVEDIQSEYGLAMLANSITLTPGTITLDIVEQDGKTYYYIHWINVETEDPEEAGEKIKGTLEKWVRRIWE